MSAANPQGRGQEKVRPGTGREAGLGQVRGNLSGRAINFGAIHIEGGLLNLLGF